MADLRLLVRVLGKPLGGAAQPVEIERLRLPQLDVIGRPTVMATGKPMAASNPRTPEPTAICRRVRPPTVPPSPA